MGNATLITLNLKSWHRPICALAKPSTYPLVKHHFISRIKHKSNSTPYYGFQSQSTKLKSSSTGSTSEQPSLLKTEDVENPSKNMETIAEEGKPLIFLQLGGCLLIHHWVFGLLQFLSWSQYRYMTCEDPWGNGHKYVGDV
jgi:hypothetical protein